jgi:predicted DNA-binding protein
MFLMAEKVTSKSRGNEKRLVVYVSQEMFEELEELATKEDRSISNFTRNLISQALEDIKEVGR